ncbi:hypothetical protein AF335_17180 [Streptomyces eurocidicus]|uniref:Uncharacterized protein n=1 Tax=Streptomyces eurocidicus TaxID=66423 RepID=A0A2N8NUA3_STREU|nr:hypothetical protein [Streptomyces eurocidicus]MBB5120191.1 hypothetical protein [Streptomyces eurocidicus]MBF6056123.1 hypothetical protein [Streptomyces eurocidicus]PNE32348.1 hypothetical protein AF335_17180 [Streptomyces eurocidicus]
MRARALAVTLVTAAVAAAATQATAQPSEPRPKTPAAWCKAQGGDPAAYRPFYDSGSKLTPLGGQRELCEFTATDHSRITVATDTLAADLPTLAALAYVRKPALPEHPQGNPSAAYCAAIGGTTQFGNHKNDVGGWIKTSDPTDRDHLRSMCLFADGSTIDAWGLTYHTNGVIRGADLTTKFRAAIPTDR